MRLRTAASLLLALAPVAAGQSPPRVVGPESVPPYKMVRLRIEGDVDSAVFRVEPFEVVDSEPGPDGKSTVFTGPPGRYVVWAVMLKDRKLVDSRLVVTIGGSPTPTPTPTPTPGPSPNPGPTPTPTPEPPPPAPVVAGRLHFTYIVDPNVFTAASAAIRNSKAIESALEAGDASWRTYNADEEDVKRLRLDQHFPNAGVLPCLIVQDRDGKVLASLAAPDEAKILAELKKWRGTK